MLATNTHLAPHECEALIAGTAAWISENRRGTKPDAAPTDEQLEAFYD